MLERFLCLVSISSSSLILERSVLFCSAKDLPYLFNSLLQEGDLIFREDYVVIVHLKMKISTLALPVLAQPAVKKTEYKKYVMDYTSLSLPFTDVASALKNAPTQADAFILTFVKKNATCF